MSIMIVPDPLTAKLAAADQPLELCAADGRLLGYFTPTKSKKYNLEPPPLPEGELDRRFAAGGGRPLADILRSLSTEREDAR